MPGEQGGVGGLVSELIGFIAALFGDVGLNVWSGIGGIGDLSFSSLNNAFGAVSEITGKIKNVLDSIWKGVIVAAIKKLLDAYSKLRDLLTKIFAPVLRYLHQLRVIYDQYFNRFVKPLLNLLHKVRQFLQIFRLLGFKWAARLDADIARIENKIVAAYSTLRAYLNIATTWIQLIVDPTGILRRNPLFAAIIRSAPELRNLMDVATVHTQTQKEVDTSNRNNGWFQPNAAATNFTYYKQGKLPPDLDAARQEFLDAHAALPGLANQQLV